VRLWRRRTAEERTLAMPRDLQPPWIYYPAPTALVDANAALATPTIWACCRVLTDAASSCPLIVYRRGDTGRRRIGGRTADLLEHPAEDTTEANFVATIVEHLSLWGNAFIGKYKDADGRVVQLIPIPPNQVQVEVRAGQIVFTITGATTGLMSEHGLDDVCHVKALSSDSVVGLSPIAQMQQALTLDGAVRTASTALFTNHARPSGILAFGSTANKTQAEALKDQWTSRHAAEQAGGIAVLSGDLSFTPLSMPADDAEFVAARKLSATELARCFRIPPWMIGAEGGDSMTYSNVESQAQAFVTFSLMPWLRVIEQALSADRDLFGPSTYCEFLIDSLLRADSMTRAQIYEKALNPTTGWMRRDEVRARENLEPEPAGLQLDTSTTAATNGQGVIA
jgi:HK97 family phage portal protein